MLENRAHELLGAALEGGGVEAFGASDETDPARLRESKDAADLLVKLRLARYEDEGRTRLLLTNPGRYWALNGGYMAFLKEEPDKAASAGGRGRNPELEQLRFQFMTLRMRTFWWSFGVSIAGFIILVASIIIALRYGDRFFPR